MDPKISIQGQPEGRANPTGFAREIGKEAFDPSKVFGGRDTLGIRVARPNRYDV